MSFRDHVTREKTLRKMSRRNRKRNPLITKEHFSLDWLKDSLFMICLLALAIIGFAL